MNFFSQFRVYISPGKKLHPREDRREGKMEFISPAIVIGVPLFTCILMTCLHLKWKRGKIKMIGYISAVAVLIIGTTWLVLYLRSMGEVADMKAFYHASQEAYEYAVTESLEVESQYWYEYDAYYDSEGHSEGEYRQKSQVSERLKELRDRVEDYNCDLEVNRIYNSNWFTRGWVYDSPSSLEYIVCEEIVYEE